MQKIFLTAIIILALSAPVFVSAQGLKDAGKNLIEIGGASGEKLGVSGDLGDTIATVIKAVLALVGTVFLVLTIYAGILWMTAQGNEEQVTKAVGIIKASVIGLIIIMSAYAITYFVTSKLGGAITSNQSAPPPPPSGPQGCCFYSGGSTCRDFFTESECDASPGRVDWQIGSCGGKGCTLLQ